MAGQVGVAAIYQHVPLGQTDVEVNGGESCIIHAIIVSAAVATTGHAIITEADGITVIMDIASGVGSFSVDMEFVADQGVAITTDANVTCTVLHSHSR